MAVNFRHLDCAPEDVFRVLADGWLYPSWVVGASRIRSVEQLPGPVRDRDRLAHEADAERARDRSGRPAAGRRVGRARAAQQPFDGLGPHALAHVAGA